MNKPIRNVIITQVPVKKDEILYLFQLCNPRRLISRPDIVQHIVQVNKSEKFITMSDDNSGYDSYFYCWDHIEYGKNTVYTYEEFLAKFTTQSLNKFYE